MDALTALCDLSTLSDADLCEFFQLAGDEVLRRRGFTPGPVTCVDEAGDGVPRSRGAALAIALRELAQTRPT